eukprot:TRINITY_DN10356_c0_g1_i3.p1 TRINITY_DN10356_c0_g1~~TRINITY_DN10356_c0_g1_i3.p1  ORF type:complete len:217 (+),score=51.81 TRINITY_DN10356_c0_g1_i3:123-773(+)
MPSLVGSEMCIRDSHKTYQSTAKLTSIHKSSLEMEQIKKESEESNKCAGGCGFYGNNQLNGYCSRCYHDKFGCANPDCSICVKKKKLESIKKKISETLNKLEISENVFLQKVIKQIAELIAQNQHTPKNIYQLLKNNNIYLTIKQCNLVMNQIKSSKNEEWKYAHVVYSCCIDPWNMNQEHRYSGGHGYYYREIESLKDEDIDNILKHKLWHYNLD